MRSVTPEQGPYESHNVENADTIMESSHKNGIYSRTRNGTESDKLWMIKSRVGLYTYHNIFSSV